MVHTPTISDHQQTKFLINTPLKGSHLFDDINIQKLWDRGMKNDADFHKLYSHIKRANAHCLPQQKTP